MTTSTDSKYKELNVLEVLLDVGDKDNSKVDMSGADQKVQYSTAADEKSSTYGDVSVSSKPQADVTFNIALCKSITSTTSTTCGVADINMFDITNPSDNTITLPYTVTQNKWNQEGNKDIFIVRNNGIDPLKWQIKLSSSYDVAISGDSEFFLRFYTTSSDNNYNYEHTDVCTQSKECTDYESDNLVSAYKYTVTYTPIDAVNLRVEEVQSSIYEGDTFEQKISVDNTIYLNTKNTDNVEIDATFDNDSGGCTLKYPNQAIVLKKSKNYETTVQFVSPNDNIDQLQSSIICKVTYKATTTTNANVNSESHSTTILNNDRAGATLTWENYQWQRFKETITEGESVKYSVVLLSKPTEDVIVNIVVTNLASGILQLPSASPRTLTFNSLDWNTPQNMSITTTHDNIDGNLETFEISHTIATQDLSYLG